jgi:site-specific recombinase XerD
MTNQNKAEIAVPEIASGTVDDQVSALTRAALDAGMPANTRAAYERAWNEFTAWCQAAGRTPLPATSATLAEYVTYLCYERIPVTPRGVPIPGRTGLSPTSVSQAQWAIVKAHDLAEIDPPHARKAVQIIKGYKDHLALARDPRARPRKATAADRDALIKLSDASRALKIAPEQAPEIRRRLASGERHGPLAAEYGVHVNYISKIGGGLRRGPAAVTARHLIGLRDRAMLLLHMSIATRISELVALNIESIAIHPQGLLVSVYQQKTRRFDDRAVPCADAPVAVEAVRNWLAALSACGRTSGPLFVRIDKHENVGSGAGRPGSPTVHGEAYSGRISDVAAEERIHRAAILAGLDGDWSGHSFRRGFATEAARANIDRLTIARGGGWQDGSKVLEGYIEEGNKWTNSPLKGWGV